MTRVLVIDNYDSFVYTLNGYLRQLGADTEVVRNDVPSPDDLAALLAESTACSCPRARASPPTRASRCPIVHAAVEAGHAAARGLPRPPGDRGGLRRRRDERRGADARQDLRVVHDEAPSSPASPQPFTATRYHSLAVVDGTVPAELEVTARTDGGVIMGLQHRAAPVYGVQFHPESVMTEGGHRMLANWLRGRRRPGCGRALGGARPAAHARRQRAERHRRARAVRAGRPSPPAARRPMLTDCVCTSGAAVADEARGRPQVAVRPARGLVVGLRWLRR